MARGQLGRTIEGVAEEWARRAAKCEPLAPRMPFHRFAGEAFELALFIEEYWEPRAELGLPGLVAAVSGSFTNETAAEIRELALAVLHWEAKLKAAYAPQPNAPVERARRILSELLVALDFLFQAKPQSRGGAALRKVRQALEPASYDGLALALESVAHLAEQHRGALSELPGFDAALLDEATNVARALREHSAAALAGNDSRSSLRNTRLCVSRLLHDRVATARAVIRFTFRAHPDLVALATSEYKRTSRAAQRTARQIGVGEGDGTPADGVECR